MTSKSGPAKPMRFDIAVRQGDLAAEGTDMPIGPALQYLLAHLPKDARTITFEGDEDTSEVAVIRIDWSKVPPEIRQAAAE
jgi:hypothetical protein